MRKYYFLFLVFLFIGCAKNKPQKTIQGKWEVLEISDHENETDLMPLFKSDNAYFKEITFYEDTLVYIPYLNREERLGTYSIEKVDADEYHSELFIYHADFVASERSENFKFHKARYMIHFMRKNKMKIVMRHQTSANYDQIDLVLVKTGEFE